MPVRKFPAIFCVAVAIPLAACTAQMDDEREVNAPHMTVVGEPTNCVRLNQIDETIVHDDFTIDFVMLNNTRYRNTLPQRCYSLGFEKAFAYEVRANTLCSANTISVLHGDGSTGAVCGLGDFVPVELAGD